MARRGNSEGSIYQRSDGYWVAAVSTSGKRRVVYAKTRREVAEKLAALQQAASTGTLVGASRLTVKDFMQQWLDAASLTCKPSTLYGYRVVVRCHLVPEVGASPSRSSRRSTSSACTRPSGSRDSRRAVSRSSTPY